MLGQLVVGGVASIANIAIHALVMTTVVRVAQKMGARNTTRPSLFLTGVMIATVSVLMAAHSSEVFVWALTYSMVGAAPTSSSLVYFAFVNYTTLLGPMAAMNGILMFGWSTAVIFEVLRRAMTKEFTAESNGLK
jgi:hypothetical protein